jgi:Putative restriction endonuclease
MSANLNSVSTATLDEYLALDAASDIRFEFLDGFIFMMAPLSFRHTQITTNITNALNVKLASRNRASRSRCRAQDAYSRLQSLHRLPGSPGSPPKPQEQLLRLLRAEGEREIGQIRELIERRVLTEEAGVKRTNGERDAAAGGQTADHHQWARDHVSQHHQQSGHDQ